MAMATERFPSTGRRQDFGKYIILGYANEDQWVNTAVLQNIARRIEIDVFGVERKYAIEDVAFNLKNNGSMTVAIDSETEEAVGYSSQQVFAPMLEGGRRRIMFTSTRANKEQWQGEGVGPETLRFSFNMSGAPDIVAGIMGWAPPVVGYYKAGVVAELEGNERVEAEAKVQPSGDDELDEIYRQILTTRLYPLFRRHSESPLMAEALDYILRQSRYKGIPYNPDTGLMKELWEKDSTMLFRTAKSSRRVEVVGSLLKDTFNCDPTTGDAIVVAGPKKGWRSFLD